jgi:gliding motility-associated protein GldC
MPRTSQIKLTVELDDTNNPVAINWAADDAGFEVSKQAKTLILSLWDENEKSTYSIDLWTKEMLLNDMNIHFFQMFQKMADTYQRATNNPEVGEIIRKFADEFAGKLGLFKQEDKV